MVHCRVCGRPVPPEWVYDNSGLPRIPNSGQLGVGFYKQYDTCRDHRPMSCGQIGCLLLVGVFVFFILLGMLAEWIDRL
jgi:hypothetical protein